MVAADSSGRDDIHLRLAMPAKEQKVLLSNRERPSDVLNTIRILIENGGSDPMIIDGHSQTALHYHTGSLEQFKYILNQDYFQVDLLQRDHKGDTISEHHAHWYWLTSHEISRLAWEKEMVGKQQRSCSSDKIQNSL